MCDLLTERKWGCSESDLPQEEDMPVQDLFTTQTKQEELKQEKAIVNAVVRYFETAPPKLKSPAADTESSIINALHRYFVKK
jgi:hypothetical protein